MPSRVVKYDVLIASPGDAVPGRDAVETALHDWNDHRGDREGVILRPRRWETGSVSIMGRGGPQSVINAQLVDKSDIVIALFYHRLGSPTDIAVSGTAEEIERSVKAGKPVHLYFAEMPIPYRHDAKQFGALNNFRAEVQKLNLVDSFADEADLSRKVMRAIEYDLSQMDPIEDDNHPSGHKTQAANVPTSDTTGDHSNHSDLRASEPRSKQQRILWAAASILAVFVVFGTGWIVGRQNLPSQPLNTSAPTTNTPTPTTNTPAEKGLYLIEQPSTTAPAKDRPKVQPGFAMLGGRRYEKSLTMPGCETIRIDVDLKGKKFTSFSSMVGFVANPNGQSPLDPQSSMPVMVYIKESPDPSADMILATSLTVQDVDKPEPVNLEFKPTTTFIRLEVETPCFSLGIWADPIFGK